MRESVSFWTNVTGAGASTRVVVVGRVSTWVLPPAELPPPVPPPVGTDVLTGVPPTGPLPGAGSVDPVAVYSKPFMRARAA